MRIILNIAILDRVNSKQSPGGDTLQINETAKYLRSKGHNVVIFNELYPNLSGFDFACIFNLTRFGDSIVNTIACIEQKIPYILFPVYWNLDKVKIPSYNIKSSIKNRMPIKLLQRLRYLKSEFSGKYNSVNEEYKYLLTNEIKGREFIIENAYAICPNSNAELKHIKTNFNIKNEKFNIVYNGITKDLYKKGFNKNKNNDILCIGAIGPRKNQLSLAKAAEKSKINVKLIGKSQEQDQDYFNKLKTYEEFVEVLGWRQNSEVMNMLASSYAHIQPSFIETPGIASMEAYVLGCKIIVSDVQPVKEYFEDRAIYINPYSIKSIEKALASINENRNKMDISTIIDFNNKFSWENVLKALDNIL